MDCRGLSSGHDPRIKSGNDSYGEGESRNPLNAKTSLPAKL